MEKLITELKEILDFKDTTVVGDIVLIVAEKPQMLVYAYVTSIEPDMTRKDEWWNISLSVLSIPPQEMVWTLRTPQMTGMEIFTMGGEERFVKSINIQTQKKSELSEKKSPKKGSFIKRVK